MTFDFNAVQSDAPIIILGECGTGKEPVAHAISQIEDHSGESFAKLNCAAIAETLQEIDLFGHVKGPFTGACRNRTARLEATHGGNLFLDESDPQSAYSPVSARCSPLATRG